MSTGPHGLSRLGLALLQEEDQPRALQISPQLAHRAIDAHRRPQPRLEMIGLLEASRPPLCPWRVGGCDSSDGLSAACQAIAAASGCSALLDRSRLPLDRGMAELSQAQQWCLAGGEDFELILALAEEWATAFVRLCPQATSFGRLAPATHRPQLRWHDSCEALPATLARYQHFGAAIGTDRSA